MNSDPRGNVCATSESQALSGTRPASAAAAPAHTSASTQEKRRHTRFKCEGNLELKTDGSTIRTWATFTDVGTAGSYAEMMTTFPVGTNMERQLGMRGFLVNSAASFAIPEPMAIVNAL